MILSVFITVISDHDKPQPPGCLLECSDVLPHDMVEFSTAAWRDKMSRLVNNGDILDHADQPGQKTHS